MTKTLKEAAEEVISLLNKGDYATLAEKMDHNVVVKRVRYPNSLHGIPDAMENLNNYMKDRKARLDNWDNSLTPTLQTPEDEQNATSGQVSGTGDYVDDNDSATTPIFFTFGFVRKSKDEEWLLINAFATPRGATVSGKAGRTTPEWGIQKQ